MGKSLKGLDPIHKVTIIPRGMALGITQTLPEKEQVNLARSKATSMLTFLLGGRAAEQLIFKDFTTGASNDIERATEMARRMVCEWGMSDKIGVVSLEKRNNPVFVGMQSGQTTKEYSDSKAKEIDAEVDQLMTQAHKQAMDILKKKKTILQNMSKALLEYETIDGEEVDWLMTGMKWEEYKKKREVSKSPKLDLDEKVSDKKVSKIDSIQKPVLA